MILKREFRPFRALPYPIKAGDSRSAHLRVDRKPVLGLESAQRRTHENRLREDAGLIGRTRRSHRHDKTGRFLPRSTERTSGMDSGQRTQHFSRMLHLCSRARSMREFDRAFHAYQDRSRGGIRDNDANDMRLLQLIGNQQDLGHFRHQFHRGIRGEGHLNF